MLNNVVDGSQYGYASRPTIKNVFANRATCKTKYD